MKIAVTGSTGFIGRHVLGQLEIRGIKAIPANRSTFDLLQAPKDAFRQLGEPEVLIHLAWGGLPNYKSLHHFESELPGQYAFLRSLVDSGLKHLLVTGTCFEYGMQSGELSEDMEARPANPYAFAKNALRTQLQYLQKEIPFNLTWARLFYMYGEGQSPNSLLPQLKAAVGRGDLVFNMSSGEQLRDYLPISQVASHLVSLALSRTDNGIVNICSGHPVSVRSIVERWIEENGWDISLNRGFYPIPDYEPMAFWGERTKLDKCLSKVAITPPDWLSDIVPIRAAR